MSSRCREQPDRVPQVAVRRDLCLDELAEDTGLRIRRPVAPGFARRDLLRFAAASLLVPVFARAGCPCGDGQPAADREGPPAGSAPATRPTVVRVCADPNNLP